MKARYFVWALMLPAYLTVSAQETYENAKIVGEDLNGTARYVGMGGALDALGADISTISSNPAGIGLFRHSTASLSMGMVSQEDALDYSRGDKSHASFDQIGFVYARPTNSGGYINMAFNYHKSRNFDFILSADDKLNNASQNKLTYEKLRNGLLYPVSEDGVDLNRWYLSCNQLDDIYTRNLLNAAGDGSYYYYPATQYIFDRAHEGYVGEYDFNISGNINNRVYLGLTMGIHDVHYKHYSDYTEQIEQNQEGINHLNVYDERRISGMGADIKLGAIFRPVEESPFRIGVTLSTPTFYDLTTKNYTEVTDGQYTVYNTERYDYEVYTPWKFGLSLGHTVGNMLALGASYEFADYAHVDQRYKTDEEYDYYYYSYESSESDKEMNRHTKNTLKGVSTLKVGAELKPYPELSVRLGYNYVSPMYRSDGFKDGTLEADGSLYASATDYTNWKSTNRITCGVGYMLGKVNLDLTYQYSSTDGEFSPFMNYVDNADSMEDNVANSVDVSNKRHQLLFTIGYHF